MEQNTFEQIKADIEALENDLFTEAKMHYDEEKSRNENTVMTLLNAQGDLKLINNIHDYKKELVKHNADDRAFLLLDRIISSFFEKE